MLGETIKPYQEFLASISLRIYFLGMEKTQADKFREAAKELETDNDEKRFDENLKKLAESKPDND